MESESHPLVDGSKTAAESEGTADKKLKEPEDGVDQNSESSLPLIYEFRPDDCQLDLEVDYTPPASDCEDAVSHRPTQDSQDLKSDKCDSNEHALVDLAAKVGDSIAVGGSAACVSEIADAASGPSIEDSVPVVEKEPAPESRPPT